MTTAPSALDLATAANLAADKAETAARTARDAHDAYTALGNPTDYQRRQMLDAAAKAGDAARDADKAAKAARAAKGDGMSDARAAGAKATIAARTAAEASALPLSSMIARVANGSYQGNLYPAGYENWSGSSLKGKASKYGASYAKSRDAVQRRLNGRLYKGYRFDTYIISRERVPLLTTVKCLAEKVAREEEAASVAA